MSMLEDEACLRDLSGIHDIGMVEGGTIVNDSNHDHFPLSVDAITGVGLGTKL